MDELIDLTAEFNSAPAAEWMTQPDGFPCGGRFSDPSRPGSLS